MADNLFELLSAPTSLKPKDLATHIRMQMSLPEETLFYDDEPALTAARLAYLEANRAALFGCARA